MEFGSKMNELTINWPPYCDPIKFIGNDENTNHGPIQKQSNQKWGNLLFTFDFVPKNEANSDEGEEVEKKSDGEFNQIWEIAGHIFENGNLRGIGQ